MTENHNERVEISTRMRPGEWSPESLVVLVRSYQEKIYAMGASEGQVMTSIKTPDDGSALVHVSWRHEGVRTFSDWGQSSAHEPSQARVARGNGESIPRGEPTKDAQGLGAVLGDAERSAIDEPQSTEAASHIYSGTGTASDLRIYTDANGKTIVEDVGPAKE